MTNYLVLQTSRYYNLLLGQPESELVLKVQCMHRMEILLDHWPKLETSVDVMELPHTLTANHYHLESKIYARVSLQRGVSDTRAFTDKQLLVIL